MLEESLPCTERAERYARGLLPSEASGLEGEFLFGSEAVASCRSVSAEAQQRKDFVADFESGFRVFFDTRLRVLCWQSDDGAADVVAWDCRCTPLRRKRFRPR
jgi:hypothetical protein